MALRRFLHFALLAAAVLPACATARANGASTPRTVAAVATRAIRGVVRYEARHPTPTGASSATEVRPARFVVVEALDVSDVVVGRAVTAADGSFTVTAPVTAKSLVARAHATTDGHDASASPDGDVRSVHSVTVALTPQEAPLEIVARDAVPGGPAGAFHIVDTVLSGLFAVKDWTGQTLPPITVQWGRGITTEWSYYRGERPAHSGHYLLELLGGQRGRHTSTDCDEHDEGIILHELGHFVMDRLSTNSSTGGTHPAGVLVDPGLAWEEGRATWFSSAVRHDPRYQDTIGVEPSGELRVNHNLERSEGPRGIGSESSVADVLWDLTDGAEGYADEDHDGVALGPAAVLRAMIDLNREPGLYPCLSTFLERLATAREGSPAMIQRDALARMLDATHEPLTMLPTAPEMRWPIDLGAQGHTTGKVDGLTSPAPSGGPRRPENGYDALRVYRVHIPTRAWLHVELRIQGSGEPRDHTDLDLELRDIRGEVLTSARGTESRETLARLLDPGHYILYVRDGGTGNRASFDLSTRMNPIQAPANGAPAH